VRDVRRTCLEWALVLILLPPSEGKAVPSAGPLLDLTTLSMPELTAPRQRVLKALVTTCSGRASRARTVLGLSHRQEAEVERNRALLEAPTAPAVDVYSGVVYDFLGYRTLPVAARRRLDEWVVVSSALWGGVRLTDHIPAYRLSGDVTLPRIGTVTTFWRKHLAPVMVQQAAGAGAVLDLRSGTYAKMWVPDSAIADQVAVGRVMQRMPDGSTKVVSHHNKATKGRLVRALAKQRKNPATVDALAELVRSLGFPCHLHVAAPGRPAQLDVVVDQLY
jgi:cytoplasmic iron level regulating protein YaaA (DUF328/UPF0246 family)